MEYKQKRIKIQYKISKDIFFLFCALNLMGYDDENNRKGMHSLRKKIRKSVLRYNWAQKYPELKSIFDKYHPNFLLIKLIKNPLKYYQGSEIFLYNLKRFSKEPLIDQFWSIFKDITNKELKKTFPLFNKNVIKLVNFINKSVRNLEKIIFIPNILDAYWRGYGFKINRVSYVIAGPGAEDNYGKLLRHELLHILAPNFKLPLEITAKKTKKIINMGYNSQNVINREYVIRALDLLYESRVLREDMSQEIKKEQIDFPQIKNALRIIKKKLKGV